MLVSKLLVSRWALNWLAHSSLRTQKSLVYSRICKCCLCWQLPRVRPPERAREAKKNKVHTPLWSWRSAHRKQSSEKRDWWDHWFWLVVGGLFGGSWVGSCHFAFFSSFTPPWEIPIVWTNATFWRPFDNEVKRAWLLVSCVIVRSGQLSSGIRPRPLAAIYVLRADVDWPSGQVHEQTGQDWF